MTSKFEDMLDNLLQSKHAQLNDINSNKAARQALARAIFRTRAAITLERMARAFWPLFSVLVLFAASALLGLWRGIPPFLHWAALAVLFAIVGLFAVRGARRLCLPSRHEARARLDASMEGNPAQALEDGLFLGGQDALSRALWQRHVARMAARMASMKPPFPDFRLSSFDPWAMRYAPLLLLCAGLFWSGFGNVSARFAEALTPPAIAFTQDGESLTLTAWIAPPDYTGAPPIRLEAPGADGNPVETPVGGVIEIHASHARAPRLSGDPLWQATANAPPSFSSRGAESSFTKFTLARSGTLAVIANAREQARWTIALLPDHPPSIALVKHAATARGALALSFQGKDDYGIVAAGGKIEPADPLPPRVAPMVRAPILFALPLPLDGAGTEVGETVFQDLSAHPLAGRAVTVTLSAQDAGGGAGMSDAVRLTLPERPFHDPVARTLVAQRRAFLFDTSLAPQILANIEDLAMEPEAHFPDLVAWLSTRLAFQTLLRAAREGEVDAESGRVAGLLWHAAMRLEYGGSAEARLRRVRAALEEALERGAPDHEIQALMQALRAAVEAFLHEQAQAAQGKPVQPSAGGEAISPGQLGGMLQALENAARGGAREEARQMLSRLGQLLDSLQMSPSPFGSGDNGPLKELGALLEKQQHLADRSLERSRRGENSRLVEAAGDALSQRALQEALAAFRAMIADAMAEDATMTQALDRAGQGMENAIRALNRGESGAALAEQIRALDALREAALALGQAMQQGAGGNGLDPLGRSERRSDEWEALEESGKRARELREEIKRRSGQISRPDEERDYLRKLIDRF